MKIEKAYVKYAKATGRPRKEFYIGFRNFSAGHASRDAEVAELKRQRDEILGYLKNALGFFDQIRLYTDVDTDETDKWEKAIAAIESKGETNERTV